MFSGERPWSSGENPCPSAGRVFPFQLHLPMFESPNQFGKTAKRDKQLSLENVTAPTCWISCLYFAERSPAIFDLFPHPSTVHPVRFGFTVFRQGLALRLCEYA
jgi:hypothetical protein